MDMESILAGLVRVGIVTDVDKKKRMARVKFQSEDMTSGWLRLLDHVPAPEINKPVLCLYLPVFNGDGYVIGGI